VQQKQYILKFGLKILMKLSQKLAAFWIIVGLCTVPKSDKNKRHNIHI